MNYNHTQVAPLYLLPVAIAVGMFAGAFGTPDQAVQIILLASGGLMLLLAAFFRHLTVSDQGDHLFICFGPIPLFCRRVQFSDVERVEQAKSTILDGWGIHMSLSGGWVWNLWGFDCVDVWYKKGSKTKKLRIGTDDPVGLDAFLKERTSKQTTV